MMVELKALVRERVRASAEEIAEFCQRWKIVEFALFGSVLRDDFRPDSDIDVLVTFAAEDTLTWDDLMKMQEEIEALFGRKVDLVRKKYLKNPYRRHEILKTQKVIYAV
ncbi:nucleotidyltransferase family protein [Leptolyngbya ohadii]|uniref:nucleotidyltransferase family protein n=1 Tax=Leptolyngbya ohadii TaxID=1962290 RepID=UPI0034E1D745